LKPPIFADLHVHPDLPWIGSAWRRRIQGFRIVCLDGRGGLRGPDPTAGPRLLGAAFYRTYLLGPERTRRDLFASLARFRRACAEGDALIVGSRADLAAARSRPEAYFLSVESLRYIRDPGDIRKLWDLRVRSLQPIHFLDTAWGGSSREGFFPEGRGGLTQLGRAMLCAMAGPGMLLDLAHMNARTARECLEAYPGPVFCSHAGYTGLKRNARNVDPDLARALFRRGGIIGVTCWRHLLAAGAGREGWTRALCAAADGLAALSPEGRSRVAIGSDRGAPIRAPAWFFSPGHLDEIAAELDRLGWNAAEAEGFLGGNALAFLERSLPAG
jgi:microsomal dipeptidase-like Zn-dependent dipeptidase